MTWVETTLGEVVENLDSMRIPVAGSKRVSGPYPYYGASGIVDWVDSYLFEGEHLLIAEDGENLRSRSTPIAFLADGQFWVNNHAHVVRGKHGVADTRFLSHLLSITDVSGYLTGSAQPKLSQGSMNSIRLALPSLSEQRAIAEVLGALDDRMAANTRVADTSEALMVQLVDGLFRDSTLEDVADLGKDQVSAKELAGGTHWNHYSLPAFDNACLPAREAGPTILSNKFRLDGPSVLWSKLNPRIPRIWNVPSPAPNAVASTEFLVLRPKAIPSAALWALLASNASSSFLQERAAGTSGSHQRVRPADALEMPMPSAEQFPPQLLDQLTSLGDLVQAVRHESRTLAQLRDTLLPALMDGTIRVKDAVTAAEEVL